MEQIHPINIPLNQRRVSSIADPLTDINLKLINSIYPQRADNSFVQSSTKEIALTDDSMRLYQLYSSSTFGIS